jgi:hypothetical protein
MPATSFTRMVLRERPGMENAERGFAPEGVM